uniref:Hypoxanthine phosphoribosyltransferase n=1 Tax=Plectus sambesii TaxID=2011161 RepID=A0A914UQN5_9BILA
MAKKLVGSENAFISIPDDHCYPLDALTIPACYKDDLQTVMIPEGLIQDRIKQLAHQIHSKLGDQQLAVLCILKGSYRFFTYLVDQLTTVRLNGKSPMTVDF